MTHSSSSRTVENMNYERVYCGVCRRKAVVIVSKSVKNPGRLYYGCSAHGWIQWVVPAGPEDDGQSCLSASRNLNNRFGEEDAYAGAVTGTQTIQVRRVGDGDWKSVLLAMMVVNMVLVAAILVAFLVHVMKG